MMGSFFVFCLVVYENCCNFAPCEHEALPVGVRL